MRNLIIKRTLSKPVEKIQLDEYNDAIKLYLNLNYMGNAGEQLFQGWIKKLKRNIWKEVQVKFVVTYNTNRSFLTNAKDPIIPLLIAKVWII